MRPLAGLVLVLALAGCPRPAPAPSTPPPPSTPTDASPSTTAAPPAPLPTTAPTWHVAYPTTDPHLVELGCSGAAVCVRLADLAGATSCPPAVQLPRGCTPGAYCPPAQRAQLVDAALVTSASEQESAGGAACCFDEPSQCVRPNARRASRADDRVATAR